MRTLAVLSAILLLAFLTHAEHFGESAEEQLEVQHQDTAIYFAGNARAMQEASDPQRRAACFCRTGPCLSNEHQLGICIPNGRRYNLCCSLNLVN
nr:defensin alpha 5-like [Dasypus novemcinctus]